MEHACRRRSRVQQTPRAKVTQSTCRKQITRHHPSFLRTSETKSPEPCGHTPFLCFASPRRENDRPFRFAHKCFCETSDQESISVARSPTPEESAAEAVPPPNPDEQGRQGGGGEGITQAEVDEAWERAREMEVSVHLIPHHELSDASKRACLRRILFFLRNNCFQVVSVWLSF